MQENADQPAPEGIRAAEKSVEETIADAKTLAELNKKAAEQLKKIGGEIDAKSDTPESESR
jgi:hypothetical protein